MEKCAHSLLQLHFLLLLFTLGNLTLLPRAFSYIAVTCSLFRGVARVVMGTLGRGGVPARWSFWGTPSVGVVGLGG